MPQSRSTVFRGGGGERGVGGGEGAERGAPKGEMLDK